MACPFFAPSRRLENTAWVRPPRYPLGDLFSGTCHAIPSDPAEGHQDECCNFGYARGCCGRFPAGDVADAVRFSVTDDTPARLLVVYVIEKNHAPAEFGTLEYTWVDDIADARLDGPVVSEILAQQARAFLGSYLSRRALSAST